MGNKSYPSGYRRLQARTDNLAIWIKGGSNEWDVDKTLSRFIEARLEESEKQIRQIEQKQKSVHTKTVKGHEYFYFSKDGGHIYVGKNDPRPGLTIKKCELDKEKNKIRADMQLCVKKKIKEHLVIDIELFKKHVSKKLPDNMIEISEVLK